MQDHFFGAVEHWTSSKGHCQTGAERAGGDRERRLWQPTRHAVQIETEGFWQAKIDYLHHNTLRKGPGEGSRALGILVGVLSGDGRPSGGWHALSMTRRACEAPRTA